MNLIERKVFNHDLHETYNMHDGVYNVKVLEKSLIALSKRLVTYVLISVLYTQLYCRQINVTIHVQCAAKPCLISWGWLFKSRITLPTG